MNCVQIEGARAIMYGPSRIPRTGARLRAHLITSQLRAEAGPAQLLAPNRGHWATENRLPHVRDRTYHENCRRARGVPHPRLPAELRHRLPRQFRLANIKAARRGLAAQAHEALAMRRL